jgi:uncharacterized protein YkwD
MVAALHYGQRLPAKLTDEETEVFLSLRRFSEAAGKKPPEIDRAAQRVAAALCLLTDPKKGPAPAKVVEYLMRRRGMIGPPPHMLSGTFSGPVGAGLKAALARHQARAAASSRLGIGICEDPLEAGRRRILLAYYPSAVRIAKIPRLMRLQQRTVLNAKVAAGVAHVRWVIADPRQNIISQANVEEGVAFGCLVSGVYRIQLMGKGKLGETVLAGFPVYCGTKAPDELELAKPRPVGTSVVELEAEALRLLQRLRLRSGRKKLVADTQLKKMARLHSADMLRSDYVGHRSPTGTGPADRAKIIGVPYRVLRENVARAYSLYDAFERLTKSPSHLQNMLAEDITHVGLGISIKKNGEVILLYLTQNFSLPAKPTPAVDEPEPWQK